jgi:hypothetical protein
MKTIEITASAAALGFTLFWTRGWARAREQYIGRLTRAQLGDPRDQQRALKAETRLARAMERFSRGVRRTA